MKLVLRWLPPPPWKRTLRTTAATATLPKKVGERIAKKCLEKGITEVVYDRGGFSIPRPC